MFNFNKNRTSSTRRRRKGQNSVRNFPNKSDSTGSRTPFSRKRRSIVKPVNKKRRKKSRLGKRKRKNRLADKRAPKKQKVNHIIVKSDGNNVEYEPMSEVWNEIFDGKRKSTKKIQKDNSKDDLERSFLSFLSAKFDIQEQEIKENEKDMGQIIRRQNALELENRSLNREILQREEIIRAIARKGEMEVSRKNRTIQKLELGLDILKARVETFIKEGSQQSSKNKKKRFTFAPCFD